MEPTSRPQIGVVESVDIAQTLSLLGFDVIGGGPLRESATAIRDHSNAAVLPTIVLDVAKSGLRTWIERQAAEGTRFVVLRSGLEGRVPENIGKSVTLPTTVNNVLAAAGWGPSPHSLGSAIIEPAGTVSDLSLYLPAPAPVIPASVPDSSSSVLSPSPPVHTAVPAPAAVEDDLPEWAKAEFANPETTAPATEAPVFAEPVIQAIVEPTPEPRYPSPLVAADPTPPAAPSFEELLAVASQPPAPSTAPYPAPAAAQRYADPGIHPQSVVAPPAPQEAPVAYQAAPQDLTRAMPQTAPEFVPRQTAQPTQPGAPVSSIARQPALLDADTPQAKVIITFAAKGGVGKTSLALALANRAAAEGLRVAVIDMNRGQGDVRSYLRADSVDLPTIYNAAVTGDSKAAVISPEQLAGARAKNLPLIQFATVFAPPVEMADPEIVNAAVYGKIIALLASRADLVIIDTQISEARDVSGLIDYVVVPALLSGAWGVGITDMSRPGLANLSDRVRRLSTVGVPRDHLFIAVNKAPEFTAADGDSIKSHFDQHAQFVGSITHDSAFASDMNSGTISSENPAVSPVLDAILSRVLSTPEFGIAQLQKRGMFGRRK